MAGFTVLQMEQAGRALVAQVRFEARDSRTRFNRYSWPDTTPKDEILRILEGFFDEFDAETPGRPPAALDLTGHIYEAKAKGDPDAKA